MAASGADSVNLTMKVDFGAEIAELRAQATRLEAGFETARQQLAAERAEVEHQRAELEREKAAMQAEGVCDEDIISLNVSGEVMAARRSTLCKVRGSLLEAMFSGRWEGTLTRDPKGRVFLEFNPVCFRALLNALMFDSMHPGGTAVQNLLMDKDLRQRERDYRDLDHMLQYLGLKPEHAQPMTTPVQLRASCATGLTISSSGKTATKHAGGCVCLVGQEALPAAPGLNTRWEAELLMTSSIWQLLVGVLSVSLTQQPQLKDGSHMDVGCYGWFGFYDGSSSTYTAGTDASKSWGSFQPSDRVALALESEAAAGAQGALVMTVTRSGAVVTTQTLQLPSLAADQGWFMHFNMYGPCSVQVSDVTFE